MKNLKLKVKELGAIEILSREQMQNVMGASAIDPTIEDEGGGAGERCWNGGTCSMYHSRDGLCKTMQTGQCRCVRYIGGKAVESVPDNICLN